MKQSETLARTARRMAVEKFNREVAAELGEAGVENIRAAFRLMAEGFPEGISPNSMPNAKSEPIVPEEFRPDPT